METKCIIEKIEDIVCDSKNSKDRMTLLFQKQKVEVL